MTHPAHQRVWLERQFGYDYSAQKTVDRKDQRNVEDAEIEVILIDPAGHLSVVVFKFFVLHLNQLLLLTLLSSLRVWELLLELVVLLCQVVCRFNQVSKLRFLVACHVVQVSLRQLYDQNHPKHC